jgi:hypothetical protein
MGFTYRIGSIDHLALALLATIFTADARLVTAAALPKGPTLHDRRSMMSMRR